MRRIEVLGLSKFAYPLLQSYGAQVEHDIKVSEYIKGYLRPAARAMLRLTGKKAVVVEPSTDYIAHLRAAIPEFAQIAEDLGEPIAPLSEICLYELRTKRGLWKTAFHKTLFSTAYDLGIPPNVISHNVDRFDLIEGLPLLSSEHLAMLDELVGVYQERRRLLQEHAKSRIVHQRDSKIKELNQRLQSVLEQLVAA